MIERGQSFKWIGLSLRPENINIGQFCYLKGCILYTFTSGNNTIKPLFPFDNEQIL